MTKLIKPDFTRNIVNISATLAEYLGCPNNKPVLEGLSVELKKDYKNVVFLILDGLGTHPLETNLPAESFLRKNVRQTLTSVFPSTTTNATTSLLTNEYPMEHGWFGWSLYFKELGRAVDIFRDTDSFTGERVEDGYAYKALPVVPFYKCATDRITVNCVIPSFWRSDDKHKYIWDSFEGLLKNIKTACSGEGRQFVYAYYTEPDSTMHRHGVSSAEARSVITALNAGVESLFAGLENTLFIVTADHGQIDIGGCIELYKDAELLSLLEWPPYLEARAPAFKVKPGCGNRFSKLFTQKYGDDFALFTSRELIESNYFGVGVPNVHADLLGDYIAVGTTDKIMQLTPLGHSFNGHHTSLTAEMEVPLIYIGK